MEKSLKKRSSFSDSTFSGAHGAMEKSMRKKLTLLFAVALMAFPATAFANELPQLTTQEATRRAINNSTAIRNAQDNISLTREQEQRQRDILWSNNVATSADFFRFEALMLSLDAQRAVNHTNIAVQRATLEFVVNNHFSNITNAQNELYNFDKNLSIQTRDLENLRIMVDLGMASQSQLDMANNAYQQALHNRANLESSVYTAFRELNRLMGTSQNDVYELVFELNFEPILADINIANYIRLHQNNDVQIEMARNQLNLARFELDNHRAQTNPITGAVIPGGTTFAEREISVAQANRDLNDARDRVHNNVTDLHNNIISLQLSIEAMLLQLSILQQEQEIREVQYSVGNITALELDRAAIQIYNLQENVRRQQATHTLLVMQLTNPNIAI